MSVDVRPALAEDTEALARFWHTHMNPRIDISTWRLVADCPWYADPPNHGWIAVDRGRIVGAMALVHSSQRAGDCVERFCNIGSLYVLDDYRGRGIARAIARDSTGDDSITYFGIDAAPQTRAVIEPDDVGFEILDDHRFVWRPAPGAGASGLKLATDCEVDPVSWPHDERRVLEDHLPFGVKPAVAKCNGEECRMLFWVRNKDSETLYYEALFISDPRAFSIMAADIASHLLRGANAVLAADGRYFEEDPPGASKETLKQPRHYKSSRLPPGEVDLLYSEVPLLGLKIS